MSQRQTAVFGQRYRALYVCGPTRWRASGEELECWLRRKNVAVFHHSHRHQIPRPKHFTAPVFFICAVHVQHSVLSRGRGARFGHMSNITISNEKGAGDRETWPLWRDESGCCCRRSTVVISLYFPSVSECQHVKSFVSLLLIDARMQWTCSSDTGPSYKIRGSTTMGRHPVLFNPAVIPDVFTPIPTHSRHARLLQRRYRGGIGIRGAHSWLYSRCAYGAVTDCTSIIAD